MVIVAPGIGSPAESTTLPSIVPVTACAQAVAPRSVTNRPRASVNRAANKRRNIDEVMRLLLLKGKERLRSQRRNPFMFANDSTVETAYVGSAASTPRIYAIDSIIPGNGFFALISYSSPTCPR